MAGSTRATESATATWPVSAKATPSPAAQKGITVPVDLKTLQEGNGEGAKKFAQEAQKIVQL